MVKRKRLVIGITGSLGSGKSAASRYLSQQGFTVLDVDAIYRQISGPKSLIQQKIIKAFGPWAVRDGKLNRAELRKVVFSDPKKVALLNKITHPLIIKETLKRLRATKGDVIIDAALLIETGFQKVCDYVIVVHCPQPMIENRLLKHRKLPKDQTRAILRAQMPFTQKKKYADFVVDTSGSYNQTHRQLSKILRLLLSK